MKKLTILFCLISLTSLGQVLPLKNGFVYYNFEHKETNTKSCIGYYLKYESSQVSQKFFEFLSRKQNKWSFKGSYSGLFALDIGSDFMNIENEKKKNKLDSLCTKEEISGLGFIQIPLSVRPSARIIDLGKKRIFSQQVHYKVTLKVLSKNEYTLSFKGFELKINYYEGSRMASETIPLEKLIDDSNYSSIILDVNVILIELEKIFRDEIVKAYNLDDLD